MSVANPDHLDLGEPFDIRDRVVPDFDSIYEREPQHAKPDRIAECGAEFIDIYPAALALGHTLEEAARILDTILDVCRARTAPHGR